MDELLEQAPGRALNPGNGDGFGMHSFRPYILFTLLDPSDSDRTGRVTIPARRAAGSLMLLETFALITADRIVAARRFFESGLSTGPSRSIWHSISPRTAKSLRSILMREQTADYRSYPMTHR